MRFVRSAQIFSLLFVFFFFLSSYAGKEQGTEGQVSLKITCLGDSITYGYKLAHPAAESYPAQLSRLARGRQWKVLNCGVNGATVLHKGDIPVIGQKAYLRAVRSLPDVVLIMLGTNDTKNINWQYREDFIDDYAAIIKTFQDLSSHPRVVVCSVPPVFTDHPSGITGKRVEEVNLLVRSAATMTGADFFDIHTLMAGEPNLFIDGIHPGVRGAKKIALAEFDRITGL